MRTSSQQDQQRAYAAAHFGPSTPIALNPTPIVRVVDGTFVFTAEPVQ